MPTARIQESSSVKLVLLKLADPSIHAEIITAIETTNETSLMILQTSPVDSVIDCYCDLDSLASVCLSITC